MIIDLRYHIASLVAVFFSLGHRHSYRQRSAGQ